MSAAIVVSHLTKHYRHATVVDDLTFDVPAGKVTAFLGPNGAGKTTTMRILLGLASAHTGEALVLGRPYRQLEKPARLVGTLLDGAGFHPGRTARNHLRILARLAGASSRRVDEVLDTVELVDAADRKVGEFSLGMRRRLGLASALVGEPQLLVLDEPANGLDPAGIRWLRQSLQAFAAAGGTVFVSSHVLAEVAQTAEEVVVINRGKLVVHTTTRELTAGGTVFVRTSDPTELARRLVAAGATVAADGDGLTVRDIPQDSVGEAAADAGVIVYELTTRGHSLEDVFIELTDKEGQQRAS